MNGPGDPEPSLVVEDGRVVELDGRSEAEFDALDRFIADHGIDLAAAADATTLSDDEIARRLVDVDCPRERARPAVRGLTPARLARIVGMLDPVEMMFALKKLRARRQPANQAHVTNRKENPALLAADAAEAAARGFAEIETTVGVARYAPLNAIAILVGAQVGRPGVHHPVRRRGASQPPARHPGPDDLLGDALRVRHGAVLRRRRRHALVEGVPRLRVRIARDQGALHVRRRLRGADGPRARAARCSTSRPAVSRPSGRAARRESRTAASRRVALALAVPGGTRAILAENLIAAWLDLEVASGNDAIASHSPIRKTAKLMGQFLPGTDFVTSGYSVMPRYDNVFGGGNYDADDLDEWLTLQRDWQVDAGHRAALRGCRRSRCASAPRDAIQAVFAAFGFPADQRRGGRRGGVRLRQPRPPRPRSRCRRRGRRPRARRGDLGARRGTRRSIEAGFADAAEAVVGMQRLRVTADYLQTAAIVGPDFAVQSAVNEPNDYPGPGTGYRLDGERWALLRKLPHEVESATLVGGDGV